MKSEDTTKKIKTSSSDLFSLLPYEITLECLAHVSIIYHPILSLVSKNFQTIISSHDLHVARSRIRKPEDQSLYVCLNRNKKDPNPRWFKLSSIPKQPKLIPIPSPPNQKLLCGSTVVSTGSEIYIIGGSLNKHDKSRKVFLLDCQSHRWRRLPNMLEARSYPAVAVFKGKIYVFGGGSGYKGEVYDPKKKVWEFNLGFTMKPYSKICSVVLGNELCNIWILQGKLVWLDPKEGLRLRVSGLEGLCTNEFSAVAKSTTRGRVTVWWKTEIWSVEIWCAEISFERRTVQELRGFVKWSKIVFTFDRCDSNSDFFLNSAIVTN